MEPVVAGAEAGTSCCKPVLPVICAAHASRRLQRSLQKPSLTPQGGGGGEKVGARGRGLNRSMQKQCLQCKARPTAPPCVCVLLFLPGDEPRDVVTCT